MIVAKWRTGFEGFYKGVDAQKVAEEVYTLAEKENATTDAVLNLARDTRTELHKCFEWDDAKAAEYYRKEQVRTLMSNLIVVQSETQARGEATEIRVFYNTDPAKGYKPTEIIIKQADEYAALLDTAMRELRAFKAKYSCLRELRAIFDLIN